MEMCYDGALVMPSSYALMDEEEMTYVEGGVTGVRSFSTVGSAYSAYSSAGSQLHWLALGLGISVAVTGTGIGGLVGNIPGAVIGAVIGAVGGIVAGSIVWGWGTTMHNCANDLYKKKGTNAWNKPCKVRWKSIGCDFYYTIQY